MPKRTDIKSILVLGSGPIVIGQACEFDYSGTQACRALRREGYRVVLVNSNPATIMTDPEFADATYIEPLDRDTVAAIIAQEKPDALLPTVGGQTALNLAVALDEAGVLAKHGVETLGASIHSVKLGEDRLLFKQAMQEVGVDVLKSRHGAQPRRSPRDRAAFRVPGRHPAVLHARRDRWRHRVQQGRLRVHREARPHALARPRSPHRGVRPRLEGVRARGHARRGGHVRRRLLDREPRPDGRPHGRLDHDRAADDALGRRVPGDARRREEGHPRRRGRDGRLEHPVRGAPEDGPPDRDRDEPARLAVLGPRLEGDGLPDREDRGAPRRRLPARRDPERHHEEDARVLRADARLRRRRRSRASRSRSSPAPIRRSASR